MEQELRFVKEENVKFTLFIDDLKNKAEERKIELKNLT